jgi:CubicO group peptidase (beta-lactamase class C family)
MKAKILVIFLFLLNSTYSQTIKENISELMTAYFENEKFNGTVLVKKGNQSIYENAFGLANREWEIQNELDSKFLIGSMSKPFTALMTLILVDEGLIDLNGTIGDYIPNYKSAGKYKATVYQLLTHTSGLPDLGQINDFYKKRVRWIYNSDQYIELINELDSIYNPNEGFKYNNLGYNLLALICEKVTDMEFGELLNYKIFTPLGMNNTSLDKNLDIDKKRADGYEWHLLEGYMHPSYVEKCHIIGLGGILSTIKDLDLFNKECFEEQLLLSKSLYKEMFTPHVSEWQNYGFGWWITDKKINNDSLRIISHGGSTDGYKSYFTRVVNDSLTIIILRNSYMRTQLGNIDLYGITNQIINIIYNQEYWLPKKSIACEMGYIIGQSGINKAIEKYAYFKDNADYYINEYEFNQLGKELLENYELSKESKEIYKLALREFPNSFLLNFSFGSILYGDKNDGFNKYYKKCLYLYSENPENKKFESDYKLVLKRMNGDK